ncbi:E1 ubiquitin-activating protein AOS1 [Sugiyamaella lignohabitans]|uniref:Ubiquitin-like 1-activating enzyme E1A n=1 Tax=Sugiyamaella lignohabitans TaxID=796027 RepID=A0A167CYY0_9ASCO|nr:E1 ubiquitin-activating protein AOS1 [Sugiyamaella lignohabitans]ANB12273.1 E1 ubiquitin-activating protein AOS1 [Sugiyamaella lignohabitans]
MRNSKILVIGVSAATNEVVKNLVLAGVGSLTILDEKEVRARDLGAQFFIDETDVGKKIAEAVKFRVQRLNPRVGLEIVTASLEEKLASEGGEQWVQGFDVVVASNLDYHQLARVNGLTRAAHKSFYATQLFGLFGYVFTDLVQHTFTTEKEKSNIATVVGPETKTRSVIKVETRKDGPKYLETITKSEVYKPFTDIVADPLFAAKYTARKLLKVSTLLPIILGYWQLQLQSSSNKNNDEEGAHQQSTLIDETSLYEAAVDKARQLGIPAAVVKPDTVHTFVSSLDTELSPVAAVIGGILAQDVLNVLGQKEQPIQNLFIFSGASSEGPIYTV